MAAGVSSVNPTSTGDVALVAALTGQRPIITRLVITNDHNANAVAVLVKDGTTEIARYFLIANGADGLVIDGSIENPVFPHTAFTSGAACNVALSGAGSCRVVANYSYRK